MNKSITKIGCLLMSMMTAFSIFASCGGGGDNSSSSSGSAPNPGPTPTLYNTETRPLVFSTDALDGNFNPFFATSATDSTIAAITQVGMMTTDKEGNPKCGDDVPTVALDYKTTMYDANGNETKNAELASKANNGSTTYEFLIKNGMKFSDGKALTIKDVLFNLYVYLDPMYMGSATIYSTDIKGLTAYRMQDPEATDDTVEQNAQFEADALTRFNNLTDYLYGETNTETEQIKKDIATMKEVFLEFLGTDWTMYSGAYESYKDDYNFTEGWEIFYYNEGIIINQTDSSGRPVRGDNGKYLTTLDPDKNTGEEPDNTYREDIAAVRDGLNADYPLSKYMEEQGCTQAEAGEYAVKDFAIDTVYDNYTGGKNGLAQIVYVLYSDLMNDFIADEKSAWVEQKREENQGKLLVETISGITTYKTNSFNGKQLSKEHDVLKIEINGVDPKAIWNFSFSVAPMHYYSGDYENEKGETVTTLTDAQNDQGTATVNGVRNQYVNFGVNFNNKEFFETILRNTDKNGLPVGAGVYKASNLNADTTATTRKNFYRNKVVYFERNTYFDTMGGETVYNANIKYMRYNEVSSNNIISNLETKKIDFGAPQATQDNINELGEVSHLDYKKYRTNGYGYVGINPKFVPDLEVRQAIMHAMNTVAIVENYYKNEDLAEPIFRSMSKESWAYPTSVTAPYYALTREVQFIKGLVEEAEWEEGADGIYEKDGKKLNLTFTIAGDSIDHPAHDMFQEAKAFLEQCGFKISVVTDINALKNLASGNLAVWAAAWNSTIDPDLYQVYHKDSKATSVKNWGYDVIYEDTNKYYREVEIIDELSEWIEKGRQTLETEGANGRKAIYAKALDLIMELAVELPTYQRSELVVYNNEVINPATLNKNPSANEGVYDRLWEVNYR